MAFTESRPTFEQNRRYGLLAMGNGHAPGTEMGLSAAGVVTVVCEAVTGFITGCDALPAQEAGLAVFFFAALISAGFLAGFFLADFVFTGFLTGLPADFFADRFTAVLRAAAFFAGLATAFFLRAIVVPGDFLRAAFFLPGFFAAFAMRASVV